MEWVYLIVAGLMEIAWSYLLDQSEGFQVFLPSIAAIALITVSFYLLQKAMKKIGIGTAYAVFTGIGAAGIGVLGMTVLNEGVSFGKIFFLSLLLVGILGLKLSEGEVT